MPTFKEFLRVLEVSTHDKTSGKRMKEIASILKKNEVYHTLTPEKATHILEDLGPTFVKMGQIASNRSDILPKEYCDAFEQLRTHVSPVPFSKIIETIEQAYQKPWQDVFATIDEIPLGSASIAQAHKASLHEGASVVIKVRRPGIVEKMAEDIMLMKHLLTLAEFSTTLHENIVLSFENLVSELERTTSEELDFTIELNNLIRFRHTTQQQPDITCPLPYPQLSTDEVLVMEFVDGSLISDKETLLTAGNNLDTLGNRLAQSYITQIIDDGFFHADPHPGNIMVRQNEIVWIDLGMTGSLTSHEQILVGKIFRSIATQDMYELKESLLALTTSKGSIDHSLLLEQLSAMLSSYASAHLSDINVGIAFSDIVEILRSHSLSLPASFTMLGRGFLTLEGVLSDLAPHTNIVAILSEHVEKKLLTPDALKAKTKELLIATAHSAEAAPHIPAQLSNTLEMLDRGELKLNTDLKVSDEILASLSSVGGRLSLALISAGLFVGSSFLCTTGLQPQFLGVPLLGFLGFLGAFVLSMYVIWQILTERHRQHAKKR